VVAAALTLFTALQDEPTPEQLIMDQIVELRKQVAELQEQMNERFNRIEQYLDLVLEGINGIFGKLDEGFEAIIEKLTDLGEKLDTIQHEVEAHTLQLSRLGQSVDEALEDGFYIKLNETINSALGYRERNNVDMAISDFNDYEGTIYTYAIDVPKTSLKQPVAGRPYNDDSVLDQLETTPLAENIMYLSN
jgi:hypothetical protein